MSMQVADLFAKLRIKTDAASMRKANQFIASAKQGAKRLGVGLAVASGVAAKLVHDVAGIADNFAKMSSKVGISVEKLQQLEFAAGISGTSIAVLRTGLQRLARTVDDAGQGMASAQEPFQRLGINLNDASGKLKDLDTLLLESADKFKDMADGPAKTALAMKVFGRAGAELIPMLNEGSAGIDKLRSEFAALGGQISTKDAKAFEEYNDTVLRVKTVLLGFRNQAVVALLPHLKKGAAAVLKWAKANREVIKAKLAAAMQTLFKVVTAVFKVIGFLVAHGGKLIRLFIAWKVAVLAVAAAQALLAAGSVAAGIQMAAAWAVAVAPLLLMVLLLGLVALAIEDLYSFLTGKDSLIGRAFDEVTKRWGDAILKFYNDVLKKFRHMALIVDDFLHVLPGTGKSKREKQQEKWEAETIQSFRDTPGSVAYREKERAVQTMRDMAEIFVPGVTAGSDAAPTYGPKAPYSGPKASDYGIAAQGATNVVVNVNGASDPATTARHVKDSLSRELKRAP